MITSTIKLQNEEQILTMRDALDYYEEALEKDQERAGASKMVIDRQVEQIHEFRSQIIAKMRDDPNHG
jgi:hypothetical protein